MTSGARLCPCDPAIVASIIEISVLWNTGMMNNGRSKGEIEAAIRKAIIKFEQEFMGRGPDDVKAFIVRDQVLIRLKGVLTPAERQLAKTAEGVDMVKRLRQNLIAQGRDKLCEQVSEITGAKTLALFTDIDVQIGERVLVFTVDRDIQNESR
jgi:uncharacterized protein YbcI